MIEISNLVKYYGDTKAVDNISFTVEKGEVLGFLGPNGAGKSTTMNIITGYLSATSGKVTVNGHDILEEPELAKKSIGYLPEIPPLYIDMTVTEYLNFLCDLKNFPKKDRIRHLAEIMRMVKIVNVAPRLIKNLSKGYKQRVGIAGALIGNPEVLVLDEPSVGLDPKQIIDIRNLIKNLSREHTVILSSHILNEVQAVCDRVVIINQGKIAAVDTTAALSHTISSHGKFSLIFEGPEKEVISKIKELDGVLDIKVEDVNDSETEDVTKIIIETNMKSDIRKSIFYIMADSSWPILEFRSYEATLEEIFLRVTDTKVRK